MQFSLLRGRHWKFVLTTMSMLLLTVQLGTAQRPNTPRKSGPWDNKSLSPDERADLVIKEMTLDEKIAMLHGVGMPTDDPYTVENAPSNRGVGYEVGVPRLGIPGIDMSLSLIHI